VYSPANQPLVAVEVKKNIAELNRLLAELHALEGEPFELSCGMRLSNSAKKFRSLLALRPTYLLAVAPTLQCAFAVSYAEDRRVHSAVLVEFSDIPAAGEAL
jgi:hypothetical protein